MTVLLLHDAVLEPTEQDLLNIKDGRIGQLYQTATYCEKMRLTL